MNGVTNQSSQIDGIPVVFQEVQPQVVNRGRIRSNTLCETAELPQEQIERAVKKVKMQSEEIDDTKVYSAIFSRETSLDKFIEMLDSHKELKNNIDYLIWSPNYFEGATSCLQWAFKAKRMDILKYIISNKKPDLNTKNPLGETLLFQAINSFIDSTNPQHQKFYGILAKTLIRLGADLNIPNLKGISVVESTALRYITPNQLSDETYEKLALILRTFKRVNVNFEKVRILIDLELGKKGNSQDKIERINDVLKLINTTRL
jgi:hypothetical protein